MESRRTFLSTEGGAGASDKSFAENCTVVPLNVRVAPMNAKDLSAHVLQALALAQTEGRQHNLDSLTEELRVRRGDIRKTISALHQEGHVDALRMRLSLTGFALGRSFVGQELPVLRRAPRLHVVAA